MSQFVTHIESSAVRNTCDREPVVQLSEEEKAVFTRIRKQARSKRRKPLWRRLSDRSILYIFPW
jgi:hypothetical protein